MKKKPNHQVDWSKKAKSLSFDEGEIIQWIIDLHNDGKPFDLDPTFSKGNFWKGFQEPEYKFDIAPQRPDVKKADCRNLPIAYKGVSSIMFDPPFVVAPSPKPGIIRDRFSCYKDIPELWAFYKDSLTEFWRILADDGIVAFKCQDIVSGGVNYMTHARVMLDAQGIGFYIKDFFVLGRKNVLWSPNMENQQHARKNHCYYVVLKKIKYSKQMLRSVI